MTHNQWRQQVLGNFTIFTKEVFDQAFFIDGMCKRFTNFDILEFQDLEVEGQVAGVQGGAGNNREVWIGFGSCKIFNNGLFQTLDITGF